MKRLRMNQLQVTALRRLRRLIGGRGMKTTGFDELRSFVVMFIESRKQARRRLPQKAGRELMQQPANLVSSLIEQHGLRLTHTPPRLGPAQCAGQELRHPYQAGR